MNKTVVMISGRSPLEEIGGGHCSYVRAHARAAIAAGYDVHIYCVSNQLSGVHETLYGHVHHTHSGGVPPRQRYIKSLAAPLSKSILEDREVLRRAIAIHSFGVWAFAGKCVNDRLSATDHIRHIMSMYTVYREEAFAQLTAVHGFQPALRYRQFLEWLSIRFSASRCEQEAYRQCDVIAVNYESVRTLVLRLLGRHTDLRMVPYSPETAFAGDASDKIANAQISGHPPVVTTITLQRPKKGVRTLLEAFAQLKQEHISFRGRIIGGGALKDTHQRYAQKLGLANIVEFTGFVENVEPWLKQAQLYVQPSIREESGALALLEAMRLGLPVVCSAVDGMAEDVRNEIDGLTVPPGDPVALAHAIRRLVTNDSERLRFATAARERFGQRHAPEKVSAMLKELYEPI